MELTLNRDMPAAENDRDLICQVAAGSEYALRKLYDVYGQRLYAYALRITGDPAAAEDAVQESLVAVWQGAGRFRGESRAITWLLGIVHHKALNQVRGRGFESLDAKPQALAASGPMVDEQAIAHEECRLVRAGLGPMTFLSAAALVISVWIGASNAISLTYIAWLVQLLAGPLRSPQAGLMLPPEALAALAGYQSFWQATPLLLALSALLFAAAVWIAGSG